MNADGHEVDTARGGIGLTDQLHLILDAGEQSRIAVRLAAEFDPQRGFSAQHYAADNFSAATTGICLYVLRRVVGPSYLPDLPSYFDACIRPDGNLDPDLQGSNIPTSNWSRSQLLMALTTWDTPDSRALGAILGSAIAGTQDVSDGGFSVRQYEREGSNPLVTHHVVLALTRARKLHWLDDVDIDFTLRRAHDYLYAVAATVQSGLPRRVLAHSGLSILHRAGIQGDGLPLTVDTLESAISTQRALAELNGYTVRSVRHPLWFTKVWRPALALSALHTFGVQAGSSRVLYVDLAQHYSAENRAWVEAVGGPEGGAEPYTWATALGLLASRALSRRVASPERAKWVDLSMATAARVGFRDFDVAVSFAGADRPIALRIVRRLEQNGLRVFYDFDKRSELLGEDLAHYLQNIYFSRAQVTIALLSEAFLASRWAGWEWQAVLARMIEERGVYVLPYYLEAPETLSIRGLNPTIGYLTLDDVSPEEFAEEVVRKFMDGA